MSSGLTSEGLIAVEGGQSRFVRLAGGARAHYMSFGRDGVPVVLLHGGIAGSSGLAGFRSTAPALADAGFQVFCPDFPGFGLADTRPQYWPTLGNISHLQFLHEFADVMCLDRFHICGNSLGCMNAVYYTVNHPERILSYAVIAGPFGDLAPVRQRHANPGKSRKDGWDGTLESMRRLMRMIVNHDELITDEVLEMRVLAASTQAESFRAFWDAQDSPSVPRDPNLRAVVSTAGRLDKLDLPGIYIYGKADRIYPLETGHEQEDLLPGVQVFYPEDCGHQAQTDQPEIVNQLLIEFFANGKVSYETAVRAGVSDRRPPLPHLVAV